MLRRKLLSLAGMLVLVGFWLGCGVVCSNPAHASDAAETRFYVSQIVTDPSEVLSIEEIQGIIGPLEGRELDVSELIQAVAAINALYAANGYITAQALLPPQDVEGGVVYIRLVEGRLGRIILSGNQHTAHEYLVGRMSLRAGDLIRLDILEADISYFNQTNDVELHGELSPGEVFGTTDITLHVTEPPRGQVALFVDNAGRSESGRLRTGVSLVHHSLFGHRDPLSVSATKGIGSLSGSVSYNFPVNPRGFRMGLRFDGSSAQVLSGEFESLEIETRNFGRTLFLTSPLRVESNRLVDGFLEYHWKTSRSIFSGAELIKNDTGTVVTGWNSQRQINAGVLTDCHAMTIGYGQAAVDKTFIKYYGAFGWLKPHANGNETSLKALVQISPNRLLPPEEQFALGGMNTVRGFEEGILTGDSGYLFSFEHTFPVSEAMRAFIFFDHGAAFPYKGNDEPITKDDFLTSTGVGLNIRFGDHLYGRFQAGIPLRPGHNMEVHMAVQLSF